MDYVRVTDVSPRDGLQNEPGIIPTHDKVRLVELLCDTGVDEVEVTSFVSPKWVPQLADATAVCAALRPQKPLPPGGVGVGELPTSPHRKSIAKWPTPPRQRKTLERAQVLRTNMTGPEQALWQLLRNRQIIPYKFRRQHPFGPYILDFFSHELRLAIELDGASHDGSKQESHDETRDAWILAQGVKTVRISNNTVLANPMAAVKVIREAIEWFENDKLSTGDISRSPTPTPPKGRGFPMLSALVPNTQGLVSFLEVNTTTPLLSKVSVFTAASETFSQQNTNASIDEVLARFVPVVEESHKHNLTVRAYISCVIACPFEGPIAPNLVTRVAKQLIDMGVDEIDLGDTIGAATPQSLTALLTEYNSLDDVEDPDVPLTLHLHDTFGTAASCVKTALDLGIRSFDGSVAGLGGCPYASTPGKRAPGNISTELLVHTIHAAGYKTNVDLDKLETAATFARDIVAKSRATI